MTPWLDDEFGHGADGWNLFLRYGLIWDQAAEGFMDSSSVLPTGPLVALAGIALIVEAAWCLLADRAAWSHVPAWVVAVAALIIGLPIPLVDIDGGTMLGPALAFLAALVPLGALAAGWFGRQLRRSAHAADTREAPPVQQRRGLAVLVLLGLALGAVGARAATFGTDRQLGRCEEAADAAHDELEAWRALWTLEERWLDSDPDSSREARLDGLIDTQLGRLRLTRKAAEPLIEECRWG